MHSELQRFSLALLNQCQCSKNVKKSTDSSVLQTQLRLQYGWRAQASQARQEETKSISHHQAATRTGTHTLTIVSSFFLTLEKEKVILKRALAKKNTTRAVAVTKTNLKCTPLSEKRTASLKGKYVISKHWNLSCVHSTFVNNCPLQQQSFTMYIHWHAKNIQPIGILVLLQLDSDWTLKEVYQVTSLNACPLLLPSFLPSLICAKSNLKNTRL